MQVKTYTLGYSLWVPRFLRGSDNDQNRRDINLIFRDNYNYNPLAFLFNLFQKTENASTERNKTFTLKTYICRENDSKIYWLPVENHPVQKAVPHPFSCSILLRVLPYFNEAHPRLSGQRLETFRGFTATRQHRTSQCFFCDGTSRYGVPENLTTG